MNRFVEMVLKRKKYINFINVSLLAYVITFIKGILTRRFISPEEYGIFVNTQLLMSYGLYLQLGTLNALNFEIPGLLNNNKEPKLRETIGSVKGYITLLSIVMIAITPIFLLLDMDSNLKYGYMITAVSLSLSLFVGMGENILRGYQNFEKLSKIIFLREIIVFGVTLILLINIGYYGMYIGILIGNVFSLFLLGNRFSDFKAIFKLNLMLNRITVGFPIFLNGMLWSLFITVSQTIGFLKLSTIKMGEFSIAVMIYGAVMIVPSIVSQIIYPKILVLISEKDNQELVSKFYDTLMEYYSWILVIISNCALLVIPTLIRIILPAYVNGIYSSLILLLSMYIIAINSINVNIITGYGKAKKLTVHMIIAFFLLVAIEFLLIEALGIEAIAIALLLTFAGYTMMNTRYIVQKLDLQYILKRVTILILNFVILIIPTFIFVYSELNKLALIYGTLSILLALFSLVKKFRGEIDVK